MLILVDHLYIQDNDIEYDNNIRNFNDLSLELQFWNQLKRKRNPYCANGYALLIASFRLQK